MAIKQITFAKKHPNARYDTAKRQWFAYRVDIVAGGRRYRNVFPTKKDAERFCETVKAEAKYKRAGVSSPNGNGHSPRVSELLAKRLTSLTKKPEQVRARRIFAYFENLLSHDMRVADVRAAQFQSFVNARAADGVKPETITREIAMLGVAFRTAPELFPDEMEDYQPPRIARPRRSRAKRTKHIVTEEEKDRILSHLQRSDYAVKVGRMFAVAWYLGLRYGEVVRLEKKDFNARKRTLRVVRWKTNDVTLFEELPAEVCGILSEAIRASDSDQIFPAKQIYPNSFYDTLRKAVRAAGLVYGRTGHDAISFHSARHSFVTRMMEVTDIATTQSLSAHSTGEMVAYYTHASAEKRKEAMRKLYGRHDAEKLRELYDKVRAGELDFEAFLEALKIT